MMRRPPPRPQTYPFSCLNQEICIPKSTRTLTVTTVRRGKQKHTDTTDRRFPREYGKPWEVGGKRGTEQRLTDLLP
eukprot:4382991-Pyramimonas_sp.AAC.1